MLQFERHSPIACESGRANFVYDSTSNKEQNNKLNNKVMIFNSWKILRDVYEVSNDNSEPIGKLIIYKLVHDIICVSDKVS